MLAVERRNQIIEQVRAQSRVLVSELATRYSVTEETIRRDLEKLEREGYVQRSYGGAVSCDSGKKELSNSLRRRKNAKAKEQMAQIISTLVEDGDHLLLDDSSTAFYAARALLTARKQQITIITNSIDILVELGGVQGIQVISTGGFLEKDGGGLMGCRAEEMVRAYYVDRAIISCKSLDISRGFTNATDESAQIKRTMMENAREVILAADSSKWGQVAFAQIGALSQVDTLVTEKDPGAEWREALTRHGVTCLYSSDS